MTTLTLEEPVTTADELRSTIAQLSDRRAELERDRAQAQTALDNARQDLVDGTITAGAVVQAQMLRDTLTGAVGAIDTELAELERELTAAAAAEEHRARLGRLVQLAGEAVGQADVRKKAHAAAMGYLAMYVRQSLAAEQELQRLQHEFLNVLQAEAGGRLNGSSVPEERIKAARAILSGLGADFAPILRLYRNSWQHELSITREPEFDYPGDSLIWAVFKAEELLLKSGS